MRSKNGRVTSTKTVWCGRCDVVAVATRDASMAVAESEWMGRGWCRLAYLWYCPTCSLEVQEEQKAKMGYE